MDDQKITAQEIRLIQMLRASDHAVFRIIVKEGRPVRVEEIRHGIRLTEKE